MYIKLLDNAKDIRKAFLNRFVMSWDEFQIQRNDWIAEKAKTNCPITVDWYAKTFMWERMNPNSSNVSMKEAVVCFYYISNRPRSARSWVCHTFSFNASSLRSSSAAHLCAPPAVL